MFAVSIQENGPADKYEAQTRPKDGEFTVSRSTHSLTPSTTHNRFPAVGRVNHRLPAGGNRNPAVPAAAGPLDVPLARFMGDLRDWLSEATAAGLDKTTESNADSLQVAEDVTQGIIARIHPNSISEQRRKAVIDYVKRLLRNHLGCEVFPFGSVPLKTYLPDGDIDLTAFAGMNAEEALANDVFAVLDREDMNGNAEFVVKDVQLIRAEVKLVKCIIQNIVVDISFNQLGGLCTLCFLEQVDRLIGKDHLLKRSILLIKAWCYYESRILGAHHGLLSTYALETLVFYKFLEFYSKFDWEKYCISLNGPVLISALPEIVVEPPKVSGGDLLFSNDFLKECVEEFSVPSKGFGTTNQRTFIRKHLNIVDPLKENNNLGRSVSRGNYFRIRSAFGFGVQKLERVSSETKDGIASILNEMFSNTMDRHVSGQRPDVQDPVPPYGHGDFGADTHFLGHEMYHDNQSSHLPDYGVSGEFELSVNGVFDKVVISEAEKSSSRGGSEAPQSSKKVISEEDKSVDEASISDRLSGDANDLASTRTPATSNGTAKSSPPDGLECFSPSVYKAYHAPHLYFPRSSSRPEERRNGDAAGEHPENWDEEQLTGGLHERPSLSSPISWSSEDTYSAYPGIQASSCSLELSNSLSDLSGDYESHVKSLLYGRWCYDYALAAQAAQVSPPFVSQFQGKSPWDVVRRSMQHKHTSFSQINSNGLVPGRPFYPMNSQVMQVPPFGVEEMRKPRGTGTYIPSTNHYRARTTMGRGRPQAPPVKSPRDNGRGPVPVEVVFSERIRRLSESHGRPHVPASDLNDSESPRRKSHANANGSMHHPPSDQVEFSSFGQNPWSGAGSTWPRSSTTSPSTSGTQRPRSSDGISQDRILEQSYHLKNDDDFPPLPETAGKGL
ncbi:hypothetical protein CDL15_Pgr007676 [Punica granatum]|uniref:Polymerase nucleotidyl transferase domain-containing protein n=1 Tax=Punica granatum TaxID=22663 RepID=A0A218XA25_PUNGR|nr:hypothetical protein CDL15_Pgr007676 [Punica granatum]